jgi:hypothetical protein
MQSVLITTNVASSNPANGEVCTMQHYVIKFVNDIRQVVVPPQAEHHDITELLKNVTLKAISLFPNPIHMLQI